MSLFKSIADGISAVGNLVTANLSPFTVQLVKPENYDGYYITKQSLIDSLSLYVMPNLNPFPIKPQFLHVCSTRFF